MPHFLTGDGPFRRSLNRDLLCNNLLQLDFAADLFAVNFHAAVAPFEFRPEPPRERFSRLLRQLSGCGVSYNYEQTDNGGFFTEGLPAAPQVRSRLTMRNSLTAEPSSESCCCIVAACCRSSTCNAALEVPLNNVVLPLEASNSTLWQNVQFITRGVFASMKAAVRQIVEKTLQ